MDKATMRALRNLLLTIYDEQKSNWSPENQSERKPSREAQELYNNYCYAGWRLIEQKEFEDWLNVQEDKLDIDFSTRKAILVLPPLEEDQEFIPFLKLKCELGEDINSMRLYVLLARLNKEDRKLYGIAFRFECPENEQYRRKENDKSIEAKEGIHDFYHAQLITGISYGPPIEISNWLPVTQPSFPLLADDPLTLVFALLMTLYGKKYCWDFYSRHATNLPELGPRIKKLHPWVKWKAMENKK